MELKDCLGRKHLQEFLLVLAADRFALAGHFFEISEELAGLGVGVNDSREPGPRVRPRAR
jgi:hypothetical protein